MRHLIQEICIYGMRAIIMSDICKFKFDKEIGKRLIEEHIALAIVTAECMFGQARVRLNAAYLASNNKVVIDTSNEVGQYIAQIFTGLMTRKFGEDKFTLERIRNESH